MSNYRSSFKRSLFVSALICVLLSNGCSQKAKQTTTESKSAAVHEIQTLNVQGEMYAVPNPAPPLPYIPSQNLAPFPQRHLPHFGQYWGAAGMGELAGEKQKPITDGTEFLPGADGFFEIDYGRAGVRCFTKPRFSFRMELYYPLVTAAIAIKENGKLYWLDEFPVSRFQVHPGRVWYDLNDPNLKLNVQIEATTPVTVPAYGMISKITVNNGLSKARDLELLAVAEANSLAARRVKYAFDANTDYMALRCPQHNPLPTRQKYLTDANYVVYIGWDGQGNTMSQGGLSRKMQLAPTQQSTCYLTGIIDSPGYDQNEVSKRIRKFFDRNPNLPDSERTRMTAEAIATFAGTVTDGDKSFRDIYKSPAEAFERSAARWKTGLYRDTAVKFDLPDKKLQSLANLTANDLFPSLVQPPGIVHDTKFGDQWHFVFCYEHVHAASDIGLEKNALDYMRLLSTNQKENGWLRSCDVDFKSDAHPTSFDASYIDALYHYYKWTGDLESVRQLWPTLVRALNFLDLSLDPDDDALYRDIIHEWKSDADSRGPSSCFETALVWKAYSDMAEFAGLLGQNWHQERYQNKAKRIRTAAQKELWSNEMAMLGSKCPLGMLRLHPECLEVQIPVWTGFIDKWQGFVITDWFLHNISLKDSQGGLWVKECDWWPFMWSQALIADGDAAMIGWALLQTGHFDEGCKILETLAGSGFRSASPGMSYVVNSQGAYFHESVGGKNPATDIGSMGRALVEGIFGIEPHLDKKHLVIRPRFAWDWNSASFSRKGLDLTFSRNESQSTLNIKTADDVNSTVEMPVRSQIDGVFVNGQKAAYKIIPAIKHARVVVDLPKGGGTVLVKTGKLGWKIESQQNLDVGQTAKISLSNLDLQGVDDRYAFFDILKKEKDQITVRLKKQACGRATLFLNCSSGNVSWIEPVVFTTIPYRAADVTPRTVMQPLPKGSKLVMLDLSDIYNEDIQTCFDHRWDWDHGKHWCMETDKPGKLIKYWFQPIFKFTKPQPKQIEVNDIPFLLGAMGPGEAEKEKDILMIANNEPYELPTGFKLDINRKVQKFYLLSLDMMVSQKCYVPAVDVILHYSDGTRETKKLVPPLNFDAYEQDFGINTVAYMLKDITLKPYRTDPELAYCQNHFTMTDIICDPGKELKNVEFKSIATETFFGLVGMTLIE